MIKKQTILPKVVFKQMPLELETEMFFSFLDRDWSDLITQKYSQFLKIKDIKSEKERKKTSKKRGKRTSRGRNEGKRKGTHKTIKQKQQQKTARALLRRSSFLD